MISNETVEITTGISLPPKTILGYRENGAAIYNVAGGSVEVTNDSDTDSDDDSDEGDGDDDAKQTTTPNADEWVPPTRESFEELKNAKAKADSESAARKRLLRDAGLDHKTGKPIPKPSFNLDDEDADPAEDASPKDSTSGFNREKFEKQAQRTLEREIAKAEQSSRASSYSLIAEVPAALEDAGWNGKNLPRMIKLLDLDAVEIDADGVDHEALSGQVAELKKDFPEFFKRQRMRDAAKEVADTSAVGGGKKQAPASEEDQDWKARIRAQIYNG